MHKIILINAQIISFSGCCMPHKFNYHKEGKIFSFILSDTLLQLITKTQDRNSFLNNIIPSDIIPALVKQICHFCNESLEYKLTNHYRFTIVECKITSTDYQIRLAGLTRWFDIKKNPKSLIRILLLIIN